jgi:hypothetical protein
MSDFRAEQNRAHALVGALGLPIPLPQPLKRDLGPWQQRPLADARIAVGAGAGAELVGVLAESLTSAGADTFISLPDSLASAFNAPGETFGRPAKKLETLAEGTRLSGIVFDARSAIAEGCGVSTSSSSRSSRSSRDQRESSSWRAPPRGRHPNRRRCSPRSTGSSAAWPRRSAASVPPRT